MKTPESRPLKVYAFDPGQGHNLGNHLTVHVPYEPLQPGPVGSRIEVIDFDSSNGQYYEPVNLEDPLVLIRGGLDPNELDPRFHQQMVYGVASSTIEYFESALGRPTQWRFRGPSNGNSETEDEIPRLRIFPHAMQEANAYYSRTQRGLLFGYFSASEDNPGANLPGQTVYTCLSHDIVAHETTHALVDVMRSHFLYSTGPDTAAFHEAFADIVALFQHFGMKEAVLDTVQRTGGLLHQLRIAPATKPGSEGVVIQDELAGKNPLVELAQQFGEAMGLRGGLRAALGTKPNSDAIKSTFEPHARGAILVAAVFDAFFTVYLRRTRDLMRIARASGDATASQDLHPDLANRLAEEAAKTARQFVRICVRALDYSPPTDITFGDFLRALITADYELVPVDEFRYRDALIEAFRSRGIRPEGVASYSEEALLWTEADVAAKCRGLTFNVTPKDPKQPWSSKERALLRDQVISNAIRIKAFAARHRRALGLVPGPINAKTFLPVQRVGRNGKLRLEIIVELTQSRRGVLLDPEDPKSPTFTARGGTTLILNPDGSIRYSIHKSLDDKGRLSRQRDYCARVASSLSDHLYSDPPMNLDRHLRVNFAALHRGF
jgi:hypothetical protein